MLARRRGAAGRRRARNSPDRRPSVAEAAQCKGRRASAHAAKRPCRSELLPGAARRRRIRNWPDQRRSVAQAAPPRARRAFVSCDVGNVQGTSCVCPVGQEPVQVANHAWRCRVKKGPQLTTPTIRCEGGRVMGARCVCPAGKHAEQGVCKSDRPTTPTDGKRYKLKVISGQPGTPGSTARTVPLRVPRSQQ